MYEEIYERWLKCATGDLDIIKELKDISGNYAEIEDRFYKNLEFGTAGLRGVIGAGTNRMNIFTVGAATQGLAEYINSITEKGSVAIAYDSRIKSDVFARYAAEVFAANGIKVYIYPELMPTPMLSFAVRYLKCDAGIVITASHNPSKYNGYKAYGPDGCQLNPEASEFVYNIIEKVDIFDGVKHCDFEKAEKEGKINIIGKEVVEAYLDAVQEQSVADDSYDFGKLNVIYTPLNGAGNKPVRAILKRIGVKNVHVVKEQEMPDGNFPTAPFPNPEIKQAFECALKLAETVDPDLLLATDPDSDRVGIAVKHNGEFTLMTGNEVGTLLLNYLLKRKTELHTLPKNPVAVKTIVSTELADRVAGSYNCELREVLTGFKFIGEQIHLLEEKHEENRFIMGFEESYGYLAGGYVRDKDAVVGSMLICEMCCYYKGKNMTLIDALNELYEKYGYYYNCQKSIVCEGKDGMEKMASSMDRLRNCPVKKIGESDVSIYKDYQKSLKVDKDGNKEEIKLPKSNVLSYSLSDGSSVIIRPSGTEPKIKIYISTKDSSLNAAKEKSVSLEKSVVELLAL